MEPKHVIPALGFGYDYDVCNSEVLLKRLRTKNGRLVLPDGMSYRVLVLPDITAMPVEVARKISQLVADGATVLGPLPERTPGLHDYPRCDEQVRRLSDKIRDRVISNQSPREVLLAKGVPPDFEVSGGGPDTFIDFIHRSASDAEVYFLANRHARTEFVRGVFRVSERRPELWNPVNGTIHNLPEFEVKDGRAFVPLRFAPAQSCFVVFRKNASAVAPQSSERNYFVLNPIAEISGSWEVSFDPAGGGPEAPVNFPVLEDWTKRAEPGVKYFSGTAIYRKSFNLERLPIPGRNRKIYFDLGVVKEIARVRLNGQTLGVVWCAPWQVEITNTLKSGKNELEVEVVNLWPNRLIGDANLPAAERRTRTNVRYDKDKALLPSGLLGPVSIQATDNMNRHRRCEQSQQRLQDDRPVIGHSAEGGDACRGEGGLGGRSARQGC